MIALWSPKGGSGTSVIAAALAAVLARSGAARLADVSGDQAAVLGLAGEPLTGLGDWLSAYPESPPEAVERLAVEALAGMSLLPAGNLDGLGSARAGAGAALAAALGGVPVVVDAGRADTPCVQSLVMAGTSVLVVRPCYLALRRAAGSALTATASGVVVVEEPGRSLTVRDVAGVLGLPVLARVPAAKAVARAVDAGVLVRRLPHDLARPMHELQGALAAIPGGTGA